MIKLTTIRHIYNQQIALDDISVSFPARSLTAIIGPNGAGKSTLLKIMAGLLLPSKGKVSIKPEKRVAYLPQHSNIDRSFPLSVLDVVTMGLWPKMGVLTGVPLEKKQDLHRALTTVGLGGFEDRALTALSGGQFQRLLFARMIVQDADILLLDEPFAAVDEPTTKDLLHMLTEWHRQGKTIIAVMHNLHLVKKFFTRTMILSKRVVAYGETSRILTPDNLLKSMFGGE
ncbi:MAG: ABC transporter ATP-binding protein [Alphaproteobacteria bacterium]|nr:ABC transporter ATP-binding protein [Alphaproteobacteria bacterium]